MVYLTLDEPGRSTLAESHFKCLPHTCVVLEEFHALASSKELVTKYRAERAVTCINSRSVESFYQQRKLCE